ncbi:hypothetical protein GF322_04265 [Candidatus Dependentiae bacterium]|nr:hypothetical protein [Candidatus Dependentiae bacterium]
MLIDSVNFLLNIFFEITIFFLLVMFVTNLFKKYALTPLYQEIRNKKEYEKYVKNKKNLLHKSEIRLKDELIAQKEDFFYLEKKVNLWNAAYLQKKKEKYETNEKLLNKIIKKRKKQKENLALLKMQEIVIPKAEKEAYKEIEHIYAGDKGKKLLKELILTIKPKIG